MTNENPSVLSHVSLGTCDMNRSLAFYDAVMATIGATRQEEIVLDDSGPVAVAYGKAFPEFWIQLPDNRQPASVGNGVHIGFVASDQDTVQRFYEAALDNGGHDNGAPGPRPHYGAEYYGCFVLDPDDNKIEATFWNADA